MSPALAFARSPRSTLRHFFWLHPEWWTVALCWFAWGVILLGGRHYAGHGVFREIADWLLMVSAMMLPLVIDSVRTAAANSLWARRRRAIAGFLAGYFAPWLAFGIPATLLAKAWWAHTEAAAALGFAAASLWLGTRLHRRALMRCHISRPLAPAGWRADRDCVRYGCAIGAACVGSCWPLMLACAFSGHGLVAISCGLMIGAAERWSYRPRTRPAIAGALLVACYYAVLAGVERFHAAPSPQDVAAKSGPAGLKMRRYNTSRVAHGQL